MLGRILSPIAEPAYAFMRIVAGAMFTFHGVQKIFGVFGADVATSADKWALVGGWLELVAGALITLGFLTRLAAFLASGEMAVAYVKFHWKGQFDSNFFPTINHGELALLYSVVFLYIACHGAGRCAIDGRRRVAPPG